MLLAGVLQGPLPLNQGPSPILRELRLRYDDIMNSNTVTALSAHPILTAAFALAVLVGAVVIIREVTRIARDASAARRARRLRLARADVGMNHPGLFLTRS